MRWSGVGPRCEKSNMPPQLDTADESVLQFLSQPGLVNDALITVGPALDNAVNYYANTPPDQIGRDAQEALSYAGQALEATIGHPMQYL